MGTLLLSTALPAVHFPFLLFGVLVYSRAHVQSVSCAMQALETLGRFETMTAKLGSESKLLSSARDALSLEPMERDVLGPMQAEITDLREVSPGRWLRLG